ncbi:bactofilin family protein [Treponema peruense]|uniref:Polymer-forming cytoskeletal protein n=1 Tax=Treponema peruense TaxID=2787628 RepID=A0A7T3RDT2_9SPIR|nr:polymer-forming cytoskeletal protein [Treponema peruense]QQA01259.1 polymer-forming cytoskeletal protein [Treponema peruense]
MAVFNDDISINSIIGNGSSIRGDIKINGFMRIDGDLEGNLETTGNVLVGENARIAGNITARSITVGGIIKGNVVAPEQVHLLSSSVVIGDIQTRRFQADENVIVHGHCISLYDETEYESASAEWENIKSISQKAIKVD